MATVKTILQNVAADLGITVPDSFVGNTAETPRKLLRAISASGRFLSTRNIRALQFEHTFSTAAGTLEYTLPTTPSFDRLSPNTAYDRSQFRGLVGPYAAAGWQYGEALLSSPGGINMTFRIKSANTTPRVDKFYLLDDPNGTYTLAYEYFTKQWVYDGSSAYTTDINGDSDVPVFDDYLMEIDTKWRLLRANGEPYFDEKDEAMRLVETLIAQENGETLDLRPRSRRFQQFYENVPETGYGI